MHVEKKKEESTDSKNQETNDLTEKAKSFMKEKKKGHTLRETGACSQALFVLFSKFLHVLSLLVMHFPASYTQLNRILQQQLPETNFLETSNKVNSTYSNKVNIYLSELV